ncbi:hypothetical protein ACS15_3509 [Ralstonia insidiosa]|uniref:Uncharacterized protein n=1 Tax=Ralstonia insidiosa TaxID=190721 RepID=A0AAC9BLA2_9RALS|nr:hypothetical protein ACS15_3509 [Ralstonia insidiosa]
MGRGFPEVAAFSAQMWRMDRAGDTDAAVHAKCPGRTV